MPQIRVKSASVVKREALLPQIRIIAHQLRLVDILTPCINAGDF